MAADLVNTEHKSNAPSIGAKHHALVHGYVRNLSCEFVSDIIELVFKFYFLCFDSKLLNDDEQMALMNLLWDRFNEKEASNNLKSIDINLLFRASEHEFSGIKFQEKCKNKGATITIIHNDRDYIFGGYASKSWPLANGVKVIDPNAFLYVVRPYVKLFELAEGYKDGHKAYWCYDDYGPIFGGGTDIYVASKAVGGGATPATYQYKRAELCGDSRGDFDFQDYEVFSVITQCKEQ